MLWEVLGLITRVFGLLIMFRYLVWPSLQYNQDAALKSGSGSRERIFQQQVQRVELADPTISPCGQHQQCGHHQQDGAVFQLHEKLLTCLHNHQQNVRHSKRAKMKQYAPMQGLVRDFVPKLGAS
jgi:hypothetical protein